MEALDERLYGLHHVKRDRQRYVNQRRGAVRALIRIQNIVPETLDLVGIIRQLSDVLGLVDVLENARVVRAIPMSLTPRSTDASKSIRETAVF